MTIAEVKDNLSAMLHGGTLNKVRNIESALERAADILLSKIDPVNTIRTVGLSQAVHDDVYNYSLPSDFKTLIDLFPQDRRTSYDKPMNTFAQYFDLKKALENKTVSIEANNGSKLIRINWKKRAAKTINELDSLTANGAWGAAGSATSVAVDSIDYVSGRGSIRFNVAVSGDGINNTTMSAVDLTDEDEVGTFWVRFKIKNASDLAKLTSVSLVWGNDLTSNYWTGVAQTTQADGTSFKVGWNEISFPWSTATETGSVSPSSIDSLQITFAISAAITQLKVDKITCSIGRSFDIKYYSKYVLKNTSGTWIQKTSSDDDIVVLDNMELQLYLLEALIQCAHQIEGADSTFDIQYAEQKLGIPGKSGLYGIYTGTFPSQTKKPTSRYGASTTLRHFR